MAKHLVEKVWDQHDIMAVRKAGEALINKRRLTLLNAKDVRVSNANLKRGKRLVALADRLEAQSKVARK